MWKELVDGIDFDSSEWVTLRNGRKARMVAKKVWTNPRFA